jgi:hypothetical protein
MRFAHPLFNKLALFLLLAWAGALSAQEGLSDALTKLESNFVAANNLFGPSIVTADFNGDEHFDDAVLFHDRSDVRIELHFRSHLVRSITFICNVPALEMAALDLDRDGSLDLVVEDPFSRERLFVWLNDGHGQFQAVSANAYQTSTDVGCRALAPPDPTGDNPLLGPSKMRSRRTAPSFDRLVVTSHVCRPSELARDVHESIDAVPNLVRGSPVYDFL